MPKDPINGKVLSKGYFVLVAITAVISKNISIVTHLQGARLKEFLRLKCQSVEFQRYEIRNQIKFPEIWITAYCHFPRKLKKKFTWFIGKKLCYCRTYEDQGDHR